MKNLNDAHPTIVEPSFHERLETALTASNILAPIIEESKKKLKKETTGM